MNLNMINKRLKILVEKLVLASFNSKDKIKEKAIGENVSLLKRLPLADAIFALSLYQKGLKREISKTTMEILSPSAISSVQKNKITKTAKKAFQINKVKTIVDPSLLGGLCIKIGDVVFDDSIQNKIGSMKGVING